MHIRAYIMYNLCVYILYIHIHIHNYCLFFELPSARVVHSLHGRNKQFCYVNRLAEAPVPTSDAGIIWEAPSRHGDAYNVHGRFDNGSRV